MFSNSCIQRKPKKRECASRVVIDALIQLKIENQILHEKLSKKEREFAERDKEMISLFDSKKNTDKRMHTQYTTERQKSLTEERALLDKEEQ
jgi:F0F1-type ATP synthase gamma subunit